MKIKQVNEWVAKRSTLFFGTMWLFYVFFIYGLLPLIPALKSYEGAFFYWSGWVQLWALPLLMVGQNVLGRDAEERAIETHDVVMQELAMIREALELAAEERDQLREIVKKLDINVRSIVENGPQ